MALFSFLCLFKICFMFWKIKVGDELEKPVGGQTFFYITDTKDKQLDQTKPFWQQLALTPILGHGNVTQWLSWPALWVFSKQ